MSSAAPYPLKLVTKADAAAVFDVCTRTIDKFVREGLLSKPVAVGAKEYWHPERCNAPGTNSKPPPGREMARLSVPHGFSPNCSRAITQRWISLGPS